LIWAASGNKTRPAVMDNTGLRWLPPTRMPSAERRDFNALINLRFANDVMMTPPVIKSTSHRY
jgi:hypothetical protein